MEHIDRLREAKERMSNAEALLNKLMAIQPSDDHNHGNSAPRKEILRLMNAIADESETVAKILREFLEESEGLSYGQSGEYV